MMRRQKTFVNNRVVLKFDFLFDFVRVDLFMSNIVVLK